MKKRSFADGGMPNATFIRPGFSATRTGGRTELTPQQEAMAAKNKAVWEELNDLKKNYGPYGKAGHMSPERLHYQAYLGAEREKMRGLSGVRGTPVGAYTPGTYDPKATYGSRSLVPGMKKGGAVKVKKMALGGIGILNSPSQNVQERLKEHPDAAKIRANALAFQPLGLARRQYGSDSPEYLNYRAFYRMEEDKYKNAMGGGSLFPRRDVSVGTYTAGAYNPDTDYIAIAQQRAAAIDAARREADAAKKAAMPVKRAKGGMTSSVSKRGDGIAQRGKTKCKMR